jgi:hypothetical protein
MGYDGFKQNFSRGSGKPALVAKRAPIALVKRVRQRGRGALGDRVSHHRDHSQAFFFAQENVDRFWNSRSPNNGSERSVSCRRIVMPNVMQQPTICTHQFASSMFSSNGLAKAPFTSRPDSPTNKREGRLVSFRASRPCGGPRIRGRNIPSWSDCRRADDASLPRSISPTR